MMIFNNLSKDNMYNDKEINNINLNILRGILILLLLCTFGLIFGFSSQDGKKSGGLSHKVTLAITNNIRYIQEKPIEEREDIIKRIEGIVRKLAHFSIYTLVGFLLMSLFSTYKLKEFDRLSYSLIIGVIYASLDEVHQYFTPDRGPSVFDVILDSEGVLFGILLVMLFIKLYYIINDYKSNKGDIKCNDKCIVNK